MKEKEFKEKFRLLSLYLPNSSLNRLRDDFISLAESELCRVFPESLDESQIEYESKLALIASRSQ